VNPYQQVLDIARQQSAALGRGELEVATALLDERAALLAGAPLPSLTDVPLVEEILRLDRDLSSAIRHRMITLRDEARGSERGKKALDSYGRHLPRRAMAIDMRS
jgi:hypothetical protein